MKKATPMAVITILDAAKMHSHGRRSVARWIRNIAKDLLEHPDAFMGKKGTRLRYSSNPVATITINASVRLQCRTLHDWLIHHANDLIADGKQYVPKFRGRCWYAGKLEA